MVSQRKVWNVEKLPNINFGVKWMQFCFLVIFDFVFGETFCLLLFWVPCIVQKRENKALFQFSIAVLVIMKLNETRFYKIQIILSTAIPQTFDDQNLLTIARTL